MRTSFIVGIFGLAVAVAGITEWASRRSSDSQISGSHDTPALEQHGRGVGSSSFQPAAFHESSGTSVPPDVADKGTEGVKEILLSNRFRLNAVTLSDDMIAEIDQLMTAPDAADLVCGQFVIEGHTDNLGSKEVNGQIGLARALAVRQYLNEKYEIPPDAMRVVSYGADRPVGDNTTQDGRTGNRRVVIRITMHE